MQSITAILCHDRKKEFNQKAREKVCTYSEFKYCHKILHKTEEERTKRRLKDYQEKGLEKTFEEVKQELEERDYRDTHRDNSPLKQADDAILVDSSYMTIEEVTDRIMELAAEAQSMAPGYKVTMYFSYGTYMLGTAWAFGDFEQSNFTPSTVWIS